MIGNMPASLARPPQSLICVYSMHVCTGIARDRARELPSNPPSLLHICASACRRWMSEASATVSA